jgi:serine O-acetyltransferase
MGVEEMRAGGRKPGEGEGQDGDFAADLEKFYRLAFGERPPTLKQKAQLFATNFGLHCVAAYRFNRYVRRLRRRSRVAHGLLRPVSLALNQAVEIVHKVHVGADVGPGFFIGHPGNIYIGARRIGRNFSVTHNVTIGRAPGEGGLPAIGDDVWIGTGSVVFGEVEVGDGATIASGSILSRSVPPGALIAGNPARVTLAKYDNRKMLGAEEPIVTAEASSG